MLKKFIASFFKTDTNSNNSNNKYLVAQLNDKVGPIDRGLTYEDPLDEFLKNKNYGKVTGGGSFLEDTGEIACCDIEIELSNSEIDPTIISDIILKLETLGAPKGSIMTISKTKEEIPFGKKEGLALYIDGQNLPPEVYSDCDINFVISELHRLTNIETNADRNWEGEKETALYFFSDSFEQLKASISNFIDTYPLCKGALTGRYQTRCTRSKGHK